MKESTLLIFMAFVFITYSIIFVQSDAYSSDADTLDKRLKLAQDKVTAAQNKATNYTVEEQLKLAQDKVTAAQNKDTYSNIPLLVGVGVTVEYESDSMVVLRADEDTLLLFDRTLLKFWETIELVKNKGYTLEEIATSGMGSQGNPTRFYAILIK